MDVQNSLTMVLWGKLFISIGIFKCPLFLGVREFGACLGKSNILSAYRCFEEAKIPFNRKPLSS
jgi:hypothetical protein